MKRVNQNQVRHWMPVLGLLLGMLLTASVRAQHAGDIILEVHDSRITTGSLESGGSQFTTERVFVGTLVAGVSGPFTSNPGFDALPGTFDDGEFVGFNVLAPVLQWTGTDFQPTVGERMRINFFPPFGPSVETADEPVAGFELAVGSAGEWHRHLGFTLIRDDAAPQPGMYLLELELYTTQSGIETSEPFWILFQFGGVGDLEAATAYLEDLLQAPICPWDMHPVVNTQVGDGVIGVGDFFALLQNWGSCPNEGPCPWDCAPYQEGDTVWGDGVIGVGDFFALLQNWGMCP